MAGAAHRIVAGAAHRIEPVSHSNGIYDVNHHQQHTLSTGSGGGESQSEECTERTIKEKSVRGLRKHRAELQGIRGIASLWIVAGHLWPSVASLGSIGIFHFLSTYTHECTNMNARQ